MSKKGDQTLPTSPNDLADMIASGKDKNYKYSVEDFFKNPEKTDFKISPNGDHFSYMGPYQNRMNLFIQKIGEDTATRITSETNRDIAGYGWTNNNRLLFLKDDGGNENFSLFGIDIDGENYKELTPFEDITIQMIDELEQFEDEIIIGMNKENKALFEPYRLNVITGDIKKLADNTDMSTPISNWITDHNGEIRIATQVIGGVNTRILYRANSKDEFKEVITTTFKESLSPLFFDFDNGSVVYAKSNLGRDKEAIVKYDLEKKKELEVLFVHEEVDAGTLKFSRKQQKITSASYTTDKIHRVFFNKQSESTFKYLNEHLPEVEVAIVSANKNEDKFLVRTYSDKSRGAYYFFDTTTKILEHIIDVTPHLKAKDMATVKPISYTSRDGLTINGYLTLPKGVEAKSLPVIINPHGGPWVRDEWGFNPEVQLFANRGYAVLQMNYRGSTGYGRAFWEKSFKQWGRTMQNDISDGVQWLIDEGIANPDKVAIYGGSYGGYATLAGVTYTPELYACAVDYVGVSNLMTFMDKIPDYWKPFLEMMYEMIGNPNTEADLLNAASPVNAVDKIQCPLFVAQGANDPRVNIDESDQIVRALRARGIEVPYMVKYNEGHGFHNEENRFEFYHAMIGFFAEHLKN